jgi:hypothetical protein
MIHAMKVFSSSWLGWPFKSGTYSSGNINLDAVGLFLNFLIWAILLSIVIPFLEHLFLPQRNNV